MTFVQSIDPMIVQRLLTALCLLAAGAAVVRAVTARTGLSLAVAAGVGLWAAGSAWFTFVVAMKDASPFPSVADVFWLSSYLGFYAALMLAVRERVADWDTGLWLDGVIAALTIAGIGEALILPVFADPEQSLAPVADTVAYAMADLLLVGVVVGGLTITRGRLRGRWLLMLAGVLVLAVTDCIFMVRVAAGTYEIGHAVDLGWALALWLLVLGAWRDEGASARPILRGRRLPTVPLACSVIAVGLLLVDHFGHLGTMTVITAASAVLLGFARTALTLRSNLQLRDSERQANTDELTGLGNRRSLLRHLGAAVASGDGATLALFDLDGFKGYNDAYGHLAGDALLAALGRELARSLTDHAHAYRLGGDEFCVLVHTDRIEHRLVLDRALAALRQEGGGFAVSCSYGSVRVPEEATTPSQALQLADTRMYAQKDARRSSTRRQSRDLLLQILHEQQPDLEDHSGDVGDLVAAVGRRLGLAEEDLDHARHAAELHDVGKVAIPPAILNKPGPLDDDEWTLMRRHTIIGERILGAVPALIPVGRLVRASHERWDGGGYPDGLAGEAIPLAARIIAVCDSYHAITTDRPYRAGRTSGEAVTELRRCAGTQFDPAVVEAFAAALAEGVPATAAPEGDRTPAALAVDGRGIEPARSVANAAAGELATLTGLRGLLKVSRIAGSGGDAHAVLDEISRTIASSLGFRTVVVNLVRSAWDDALVTTVVGSEDARAALLGTAQPLSTWRTLLDERFRRGPAYFVPDGSFDWGSVGSYVPDLVAGHDVADAWRPGDALFMPLRSARGDLLGIVSVDEPVWGVRPSDDELEVLGALAGHGAVALEHAREARGAQERARADERLADLAPALLGAHTPEEVADAAADALCDALHLGWAVAELVDDEEERSQVEAVLEASPRRHVVLLAGDAAATARARCGRPASRRNGVGPAAWSDHLLAVPIRRADGGLLAVLWADDPGDRLLPCDAALRVARSVAGQSAVALGWAERAASVAS